VNFNQTWQAHIMVNDHCATMWMQKVKIEGHTRLKTDLKA